MLKEEAEVLVVVFVVEVFVVDYLVVEEVLAVVHHLNDVPRTHYREDFL